MARDSFEREIDYLRISITDRCNLSCTYCMPALKPKTFKRADVMTGGEIVRLVKVASGLGVRKVRLTGGEPLLREDIVELVQGIKDTGVPDLSVTTNGMFLSQKAAELQKAGLDRLNVSMDTMRPERFKEMTGGGDLSKVLDGISEAERLGLDPIKINVVPIRGTNDDEAVEFARLTMERPVHVRFIELMPSRKDWDESKYISAEDVRLSIEAKLGKLEKWTFKGKGPSRNFTLEGAKGVVGFISAVSHSFCYCCNRMRITAVGKIRPCLFSKTEIDLLTPMRQGASDEELVRLFRLAIESKPEGNYLKDPGSSDAIDSMSSIGG